MGINAENIAFIVAIQLRSTGTSTATYATTVRVTKPGHWGISSRQKNLIKQI
jgi:hypothetical protein